MSDPSSSGFSRWPLPLRMVVIFVGLTIGLSLVSGAALVLLYYTTVGGIRATAVRNDLLAAALFAAIFTALYAFIVRTERTFGSS